MRSDDTYVGKFSPIIVNSEPPKLNIVVLLRELITGSTLTLFTEVLRATPYPA